MNVDSSKPFKSLLGNASTQPRKNVTIGTEQKHVLTFLSSTNPAVFVFDNIYENVTNIEIVKTRIERSEHTCEYYRNTPFVVLTSNCESLLMFDNNKFVQFKNELCLDPSTYFTLIQNNLNSTSVQLIRSFYYNYTESCMSQEPTSGMCPFVLHSINYTISTLVNALNTINTFYQSNNTYVPSITASYNTTVNLIYFESNDMFSIIPSNAYSVVGFRSDTIYIAQLNIATNKFTVYADFPPKLDGPDTIYIENDETYPGSFKNTEYISLSTVFLPNERYPYINTTSTEIVYRPLQLIQKLPKLTLTMYTDLVNRFLYQLNAKTWYVDIIIYGKV